MASNSDIIGLDVGDKRIGIARVSPVARIPESLEIVANDTEVNIRIKKICELYGAKTIIVGVPHNMSGQETAQSHTIMNFAKLLASYLGESYNIKLVDESLSTVTARKNYPKLKYIDDKAAAIILDNYLEEHVS